MTQTSVTAEAVRENLLAFLGKRAKTTWEPDQDLFASGSFSSLFALELVMHLESAFGIAIGAEDLRLEHFRTVATMTELVLRLRANGE
ncbi:acyl carrier protein [Actinophytocola sp.]|uniref:acyl carrier protein n=1 Tax=Actinophytocola sp. TaxID=1872138 RepID=UPI003D6BA74D